MGMTHIVLGAANEDVMEGAKRSTWNLRVEGNRKGKKK